jgi:hypothetical protein
VTAAQNKTKTTLLTGLGSATSLIVTINEFPYSFSPSDVTFTSGTYYDFELRNNASSQTKHYWTSLEFVKTVAVNNVETTDFKITQLPYLADMELLPPANTSHTPTLNYRFVAFETGNWNVTCTIVDGTENHAQKGMNGTINVTAGPTAAGSIDLEMGSYNTSLMDDARRSGSNAVWSTRSRVSTTVTLGTAMSISSSHLTVGVGYVLRFSNTGSSDYTVSSATFFQTCAIRKIMDTVAEVKAPYVTEFVVKAGKWVEFYVVPTVAGTYEVANAASSSDKVSFTVHAVEFAPTNSPTYAPPAFSPAPTVQIRPEVVGVLAVMLGMLL